MQQHDSKECSSVRWMSSLKIDHLLGKQTLFAKETELKTGGAEVMSETNLVISCSYLEKKKKKNTPD